MSLQMKLYRILISSIYCIDEWVATLYGALRSVEGGKCCKKKVQKAL